MIVDISYVDKQTTLQLTRVHHYNISQAIQNHVYL